MTDPSYAGQIITFTFPHIGNVGANPAGPRNRRSGGAWHDHETDITNPANWRSDSSLHDWMVANSLPGIAGIDTRALTRRIRDIGAPNGVSVP